MQQRIVAKFFSMLCANSFAGFGKHSVITPPLRIAGEKQIRIGNDVFIGSNCWLQALSRNEHRESVIEIRDGTSMVGSSIISAVQQVIIEENVLIARNVYISDHMHQFEKVGVPVREQGLSRIAPVRVKAGAWIGQNAVIGPGITIGKGTAIGANSVVMSDLPDYVTAAGAPARILRQFG
jgi:acetyltransferase-like isoleucine patch superfamily enzyme